MVGLAGAGLNAAGAASLTTPGSPGKGAPRERRGPKDDRERAEFDHVTSETLDGCADAAKLRRMEWYFRTEGFPTTAAAVGARLQQLGEATWAELDLQEQRRAEEQLQRMRGGLSSWQQDLDLLQVRSDLRPTGKFLGSARLNMGQGEEIPAQIKLSLVSADEARSSVKFRCEGRRCDEKV